MVDRLGVFPWPGWSSGNTLGFGAEIAPTVGSSPTRAAMVGVSADSVRSLGKTS